jgi:competence protein ComEC
MGNVLARRRKIRFYKQMELRSSNWLILFCACLALKAAETRPLDMYWVDVEGGAATLIVTPAGESVLIDTGMPGERDPKRIAKVAGIAGVSRIDHLVITHFHIDHFGGAADVAKLLPIGTIYDNGIPDENPDNPADPVSFEKNIKPYRAIKAANRVVLKAGDVIPLKTAGTGPALSLRCLGGMQQFSSGKGSTATDCKELKMQAKDTSDNANSLVLVLKFGEFEMFDGGDLTWNVEGQLVCPTPVVGPVDIYDVNHHGLDVSNNPILVRALSPRVAVMSNGNTKGCGAQTFSTLKSTPGIEAIYQIHRNLRSDSQHNTEPDHIANAEKDCAANFIKVTVAPTAETYTVSIPGRGHSRTFQTR